MGEIIYLDQYREKLKATQTDPTDYFDNEIEFDFCTDYFSKRYLIESDSIELCHLKTTDSGRRYYLLKAPYVLKGVGIKNLSDMNTEIKSVMWYGYQLTAKALIKLVDQYETIRQAIINAKREDEIMLSHQLLPINNVFDDDVINSII